MLDLTDDGKGSFQNLYWSIFNANVAKAKYHSQLNKQLERGSFILCKSAR